MPIDEKNISKNSDNSKISLKKYVAIKSTKVTCNGDFELIEGQEIPKEISKPFIDSLLLSNLIKLIKE